MAKLFELTPEIRQIAQDGIDDLIDQLGKECKLLYPPITTPCPNCVYDPVQKKSTGKYKSGGPFPFTVGTCQVCRGLGMLTSTPNDGNDDKIIVLCEWNPRKFINFPGGIQIPRGALQTKGYLTEVGKVFRARRIQVQLAIAPYRTYIYNLVSEPIDPSNIVPNRYFVCLWEREAV